MGISFPWQPMLSCFDFQTSWQRASLPEIASSKKFNNWKKMLKTNTWRKSTKTLSWEDCIFSTRARLWETTKCSKSAHFVLWKNNSLHSYYEQITPWFLWGYLAQICSWYFKILQISLAVFILNTHWNPAITYIQYKAFEFIAFYNYLNWTNFNYPQTVSGQGKLLVQVNRKDKSKLHFIHMNYDYFKCSHRTS